MTAGRCRLSTPARRFRQAALALASAHEAGLVHRDIKPSNLLLQEAVRSSLLDLGLARLAGEAATNSSDLTTEGIVWHADYMATRTMGGRPLGDARTDLYALGCTLFFLLKDGRRLECDAHRTAANKMKSHLLDPVPDLHAARKIAPQDLDAIYRKLMAKKPEDRLQSAMELAEALTPFSSTKSSAGTAPTDAIPAAAPVVKVNEADITSVRSTNRKPGRPGRSTAAGSINLRAVLLPPSCCWSDRGSRSPQRRTKDDGQDPGRHARRSRPTSGSKVSITQAPESDTPVIPEAVV